MNLEFLAIFLFLEVVTLAYLITSQSIATNVSIFGNVWACTSQHLPSSFNPWLTLLNLPFKLSMGVSEQFTCFPSFV